MFKMVYRSIIKLEKPQTHKTLKVKRTSSREQRSGTSLLKQRDPQVERFRTGIFVRFEEMSKRWAFVSLLFVVFDHSIMLLSDWRECLYTLRSQKKRGGKTFAKCAKLFPTALPFFPPAPGVRAKHAKPLSAMLECSKIKQRERRSKNKCPVTFLQIKFFRHPQIA